MDFSVRRYDIAGADTVFVNIADDGSLESAVLLSRRAPDPSDTVDLREGFGAVAKYMDPLKAFSSFSVEYLSSMEGERVIFFEDDYFGSQCRYYLNSSDVNGIFVVFENGETMTVSQALEERRTTVEELVARGLYNVSMVPIDNPLEGDFVVLHHLYLFSLNGEAFYPSTSFMYVVGNDLSVYYDIDELIQILKWYGYDAEAENLRSSIDPADRITIAGREYALDTVLTEAGIVSDVGWALSSHTPVNFSIKG
jgi:hypothetical protein